MRAAGPANHFPTHNHIGYPAEMTKPRAPAAQLSVVALAPEPAPNYLPARRPKSSPEPRWTGARMGQFLDELAASQSVAAAARAVGMSRQSAYRLRARLQGAAFGTAWEAALQLGYDTLHRAAFERALHGVEVPVYHKGELVGTRRQFDARLTTFLLSSRNRHSLSRSRDVREDRQYWTERFDQLIDTVKGEYPDAIAMDENRHDAAEDSDFS